MLSYFVPLIIILIYYLPKTNIATENRPLEKEIPIGNHHFQVRAVSFREGISYIFILQDYHPIPNQRPRASWPTRRHVVLGPQHGLEVQPSSGVDRMYAAVNAHEGGFCQ